MAWYYADNGKQTGPFTDEQFRALVGAGTVRAETLVWCDGMANWLPYAKVAPAEAPPVMGSSPGAAPAAAAPGYVLCNECGQAFPPSDVIRIADRNVCATCKPRLVQRLTEGAAPSGVGTEWIDEQQLLSREYRVDIGSSIERAWTVFSANAGSAIVATLVVGLVFVCCHTVAMLLGIVIPMIHLLLQPVYIGPLMGGLLWYSLRLTRGEPATLGDAFAGFSRNFSQLFLAVLVQTLLTVACFVPIGLVVGVGGMSMAALRGGRLAGGLGAGLIIALLVTGLVAIAAITYITILWTHSLLLIVDKKMNFWPAMQLSRKMVSKSWGMTFLFVFVAGMISGAGAIACLIGILVTFPLYTLMKANFYDDNFRDLRPAA